ncbi:MAG: hypothetical protein US53_C0040G0005 [Candidatus Woesebacteria bacterium GW2011_GWA1_37_7]|uniref:Uncharacterized protein n=1 Tax=Candidatus Woesebacteria bacterium GW2011_GWA1_37_7 TaxID=1618545 RepID=A0A0G0K7Z9_9BACT|nr:MAG: hypothetical protein US53_C0040G0005 [Candidatus Woesebacteria bacterium GW2011_GWA1_37_7]
MAEHDRTYWWANPKEHPLPKLPETDYLTGPYLKEISQSQPHRRDEVIALIQLVNDVREGTVGYRGRGSSEIK